MSEDRRPVVVFRGNCQAQHLAAILEGAGFCTTYLEGQDYGFIPSFRGTLTRYVDLPQALEILRTAREAGRPAILAQQTTPLVDADESDYAPLVDRIVRFPFLQFTYAAKKQFYEPNFVMKRLPRLCQADLDMIFVSQGKAGTPLDFAHYISLNQAKTPLFHATTHPNGVLTSMLFRVVADQILGSDMPGVAEVEQELKLGEGINFTNDTYLPPEAREILGFSWPAWYDLYSTLLDAGDRADWQWIEDNLEPCREQFWNDTLFIFNEVRFLLARSRAAEARPVMERLLAKEPGCSWFWHVALELEAVHERDNVPIVFRRAEETMGATPIGPEIMAKMRVRASELGFQL